jgi:integrase/recombinase XerC
MRVEDAIERFETQLRADGRSRHTVGSYLRDVSAFAGWLVENGEAADVERFEPELLGRFVTSRAAILRPDGQPKLPSSIDKLKMSLKAFFSYLVKSGVLATSPARLLKARRSVDRAVPEILTADERRRLLKTPAETRGDRARRDHMILDLLLYTGIRLESLVALDVDDVRLPEKHVVVRRLKGGGETRKFLRVALRRHLEDYLRFRNGLAGDCPALFLSNRGSRLSARQVERIVAAWLGAAGIEKDVTPHSLRHTFATHLYERSRDLLVVQRALDHRNVATTQIYAQLSDEAVENAIERM